MKSCDMMVMATMPNIRVMTTVIAEASPRVILTSNLLTIGSKRSISRLEKKQGKIETAGNADRKAGS